MMEPYLKPRWSGVDRLEIYDEQGDIQLVPVAGSQEAMGYRV